MQVIPSKNSRKQLSFGMYDNAVGAVTCCLLFVYNNYVLKHNHNTLAQCVQTYLLLVGAREAVSELTVEFLLLEYMVVHI